jgi:hypothetical protein
MNPIGSTQRAAPVMGLGLMLGILIPQLVLAQAPVAESEFQYHAQPRDTLIGLGRRLLLEPRRWHELQSRNHIADPRRIPPGAIIQIPYEWLRTGIETASVANTTGMVQQAGGKIAPGDALAEGSVIETGSDGSVTIDLADGSVVTLQKSSTLRLEQMERVTGVAAAHSIRLKLQSGRIETIVKPHRDVGRFEIVTPVAVSAVRGTQFRNSFSTGDDRASTETLDGTVNVAGSTAAVPVSAGYGTRVDKDRPPLPPVVLLPPPDLSALPQINTSALLRVPLHPVAGAKAYRVQLSSDAQFHAIAADTVTPAEAASIGDVPDGDYWLRARSIDGLGLEGADAVRRLTQHVLPDPPVPTAPANAEKITGTHVHLAWTQAGPGTRYALQVAHDSSFTELALDRSVVDAASAEVDDLPAGQYFWRVASRNARDESGRWSEVQSYIQRPAMGIPSVPRVTGKRLDIGWEALPGQTYRAQIARDADFEHIVLDQRLDEPRWLIPKLFPGNYYLRVQGIETDGSAGPFGPARRFESPVPLWVKIVAPLAVVLIVL